MTRKHRRCPHCKGIEGFEVIIWYKGFEEKLVGWNGKVIDQERHGADDVENYVVCAECHKPIDKNLVDLKNV